MSGRIVQAGDIYVYCGYVASGLGATGLTVTIDVWRNRGGTVTEVVTAGSATEAGDGLYYYKIASANVAAGDDFMYTFKTAGTADQKHIQGAVWVESNFTATVAARIDAAISSVAASVWAVATSTLTTAGTIGKLLVDNINATISSRSTLTAANVWDYLSASATTVGSLGKRIVDYLTGDIYARIGAPAGASVSADIAAVKSDTGGLVTSVADLPTNAELATALDPIATVAEVTAATAPLATTADLTLVYNRIGAPAGASVSADVASVKSDTNGLRTDYTTPRAAKLDNLDAAVSTRSTLTAAGVWDALLTGITTVGSIGKRIKDYLDIQVSTIPALTATALRAVVVTFRTPVESEGKINIRAGDDYTTGVYDRAFVWELTNLPELVGGTASMVVDGVELTTTGTVTDGGVNGDGDTVQIVTVEVTAAQSALLVSDNWGQRKLFSVQITQGGELMTEISGTANVYPPHV